MLIEEEEGEAVFIALAVVGAGGLGRCYVRGAVVVFGDAGRRLLVGIPGSITARVCFGVLTTAA